MGVIGVIPTKVCGENGPIRRGDLLVTSSLSGHAMKADPDKVKTGQIIGKALQELPSGSGKIKVLVECIEIMLKKPGKTLATITSRHAF